MATELSLDVKPQADAETGDENIHRLGSSNPMEPGQYWRCLNELESHTAGLVYLLMEVREVASEAHSVRLCTHPGESRRLGHCDVLMADFLANFEPAPDGEQIRKAEQQAILAGVAAQQQRLLAITSNPLGGQDDPELQAKIAKEIEMAEREEIAAAQATSNSREQTEKDLRRIHRRAAKRSQDAGNPLVVRSSFIGSSVAALLDAKVNEDALSDLKSEAVRRGAIAAATGKWLEEQTREIQSLIEGLTPYMQEAAQVALAQASGAIKRVQSIQQGLTSLSIYTGDGVTVVPVVEGQAAPSSEPLTLFQAKRYMDEELVVWEDVPDSFDYNSAPEFFKALAANPRLRDQILATPRCVVAFAVTRRNINYGEKINAREEYRRQRMNRDLFLLVRNGDNIHAVYSEEPTHEMSPRLFPSSEDIGKPFVGIDGATVGLQDLSYPERAKMFELMRLSYIRFLILLCGLDHRLKLLGDFYPPQEGLQFISQGFQQRYMRFIADDDQQMALADNAESLSVWYKRQASYAQSGSRIIISPRAAASCPQAVRLHKQFNRDVLWTPLIAREERGNLYVAVGLHDKYGGGGIGNGRVWLTGPEAVDTGGISWLCVDRVTLNEVERFMGSRKARSQGDLSTLRTLVRAKQALQSDLQNEQQLRTYLLDQTRHVDMRGLDPQEEITRAIATWRAANRGAAAPQVSDKHRVNAICTVLFPARALSELVGDSVRHLAITTGLQPLRLCRTGKAQLILYAHTPADHPKRAAYPQALRWGWVSRYKIQESGGIVKLGADSLEWLRDGKLDASEEVVAEYEPIAPYLHETEEPNLKAALAHCERASMWETLWPELVAHWTDNKEIVPNVLENLLDQMEHSLSKQRYWPSVRLMVPVALRQISPSNSNYRYSYIGLSLMHFLLKFASTDQRRAIFDRLIRLGWRNIVNGLKEEGSIKDISTKIYESEEPVDDVFIAHVQQARWATVKSHQIGGTLRRNRGGFGFGNRTTRAHRREQGGLPHHAETEAALSLNRAFDRLMDRGTFNKRLVIAKLLDEVKRERGWSFSDEELSRKKIEKLQEEIKAVKAGRPCEVFVSGLVWDESAGRSHANRLEAFLKGIYVLGQQPEETPQTTEGMR